MARRRVIELAPGVVPFNRTAREWRDLSAPEWVIDTGAAAEMYVGWALPSRGGGTHPDDEVIRRYFVEMSWLKRCVRPQFLLYRGELTDAEMQLFAGQSARWGRPGRCWNQVLAADAPTPEWLACCRRRRG